MKAGWQIKTLDEVCIVERGSSPRPIKEFFTTEPDGVNWIKIGDTEEGGKYVLSTRQKITPEGAKQSRYVKEGDFILTNSMSFGRPYIMKTDGYIHDGWFVLRLKDSIDTDYFYHLLSSNLIQEQFTQLAAGAIVKNISGDLVKKAVLPIAPLPEQKRLVTLLDEAFESIATAKANAQQNLKNARALFDSHLNEVFTKRGEGWEEKKLLELCDIKHGFAFDGDDFSKGVSKDCPLVITPGNFTENGKLLFDERNSKRFSGTIPVDFLFNVGDLVIVMTDLSSKMKILGKPAFVETNNVLHNQRIGRIIFSDNCVEKEFLYYFMMSSCFLKNIKSSATGTMVRHTAPTRILSNVISFPCASKQKEITNTLDTLRQETQRLEALYSRKIAALDELKKALLHRAFSGEL